MDASRIEEMQREYDEGLTEDLDKLRELIREHLNALPEGDSVAAFYCANILESPEPDLWSVHNLIEHLEAIPELNDALIAEVGRSGRSRLLWAYYHKDDDQFSRYLDRTYELPAGDYYITDPCYLMEGTSGWRWDEGIWGGEDLADWGIPTSYMRDTIFGDWGCALVDDMTGERVGTFGADAGLVVVALVDEVLEANPDFAQWAEEHDWCVARINDFYGTLSYEVTESEYVWNNENETDYELTLVFDGVNARTGEPMRLLGGMGLD